MMDQRLPWNGREGFIYGSVIALITCIFMMTFCVSVSNGRFDAGIVAQAMISLPLVWLSVMLLMNLFVARIASRFVSRFTEPSDSFYTKITFSIIACVLMMSMLMTLIGPAIGHVFQGESIVLAVQDWPSAWPRNFCAAFWCEMLLAQPIARALMKSIHTRKSSEPESEQTV